MSPLGIKLEVGLELRLEVTGTVLVLVELVEMVVVVLIGMDVFVVVVVGPEVVVVVVLSLGSTRLTKPHPLVPLNHLQTPGYHFPS